MVEVNKVLCIGCLVFLVSCSDADDTVDTGKPNLDQKEAVQVQSPLQQLVKPNQEAETLSTPNSPNTASIAEDDVSAADDSNVESFTENEYDTELSDDYSYEQPVYKVALRSEESSGVIQWEAPQGIAYSNAEVIISDASGETIKRSFGAGESIELHSTLPDGIYGWETVITPEVSPRVRDEMRAVRQLGDQRAEKELLARLREEGSLPSREQARENRQSGHFIVKDGVVRPSYAHDDPNDGDGKDG